jgi:branched-chain amino acid transport system substrate-binding protein
VWGRSEPPERDATGDEHKEFHSNQLLPGLSINTGPKDYAPIKQVQLTEFEGERWVPLGDPVEGN